MFRKKDPGRGTVDPGYEYLIRILGCKDNGARKREIEFLTTLQLTGIMHIPKFQLVNVFLTDRPLVKFI